MEDRVGSPLPSQTPVLESAPPEVVTTSELIELCATDHDLFEHTFFPDTVRQESAPFHSEVWRLLESSSRKVNIQIFRGGAKTTKLRAFTARRIAYGNSRTILYVGLSQDKAIPSVNWIAQQVENNRRFAEVFRLRKGSKWTDTHREIVSELTGQRVNIIPYGITGSIRGVNIDDWRPDLIIVDDVINEENSATEDQRVKIDRLIYGALYQSLTPRTESPDAKLVMLQTPLNREDTSTVALGDNSWKSARFGCWSKETEDLADDEKESAWPNRFTTEELRKEKRDHLKQNRASVFTREMECKLTSAETTSFHANWLKFYDLPPNRNQMQVIAAIDPVPPPSELQIQKGLKGKDYETLSVMGTYDNKFYLLDYIKNRGHEPSWTTSEFFRLSLKWKPTFWVVETIAYQKTLEWILRKAMREAGIYFAINEFRENRSKFNRIVDAFAGPASNGALVISKEHTDFIQQFNEYPDVTHDDVIDAASMCMVSFHKLGVGVYSGPTISDRKTLADPQNAGVVQTATPARFILRQGAP